jgi:hypothetical protein
MFIKQQNVTAPPPLKKNTYSELRKSEISNSGFLFSKGFADVKCRMDKAKPRSADCVFVLKTGRKFGSGLLFTF